jgi:hypothetical protein
VGGMRHQIASEAGGPSVHARVTALLSEALAIVDAENLPPSIGARLAEVIEAVQQLSDSAGR